MAIYSDMDVAQYENVNALRSYPFACDGPIVSTSGFELPTGTIVDLRMVVPADLPENGEAQIAVSPPASVKMTSLHVSESMISVCFRSESGGRSDALSVTVTRETFKPYFPYRMEKLIGSSDIGGVVTFGDILFPGSPETYFFNDAEIATCCIAVAKPPALRSFVDRRSGESVSGDVDISFSGHIVAEPSEGAFRLSLQNGSAEELMSECNDVNAGNACGATPISTINGVSPDEYGNIVLWFH